MKIAFILTVIFIAGFASGQVSYISFADKPILFKPKQFHIESVTDVRTDTSSLGTISNGATSNSIQFKKGLAVSLEKYLHYHLSQDTATIPVTLCIKEIRLSEAREKNSQEIVMAVNFDFIVFGKKLSQYKGRNSRQDRSSAVGFIEEMLRNITENCLQQLDDWLLENKEEAMAPFLSPVVHVTVKTTSDVADRLAYDSGHPLTHSDFTGTPNDMSKATAETRVEIRINYSSEMSKGRSVYSVTVFPFFDKNLSWKRAKKFDDKVLAHEQRHFDIAFLSANQLAAAIKAFSFTHENFEKELVKLYEENEQELNKIQREYDSETRHGLDKDMQELWNKRIIDKVQKTGADNSLIAN